MTSSQEKKESAAQKPAPSEIVLEIQSVIEAIINPDDAIKREPIRSLPLNVLKDGNLLDIEVDNDSPIGEIRRNPNAIGITITANIVFESNNSIHSPPWGLF
jgi:hypothetical protein